MQRVTAKTSTIFIGLGKETLVYRSMTEVPPPLRKRLRDSTNGANTATIVIADKRGRKELERVARKLAAARGKIAPEPKPIPPQVTPRRKPAPTRPEFRNWLELLLPIVLGASLWFFLDSK